MSDTCAARKTVAANDSGCLEKDGTRCTLWTKARNVSYDDFGSLVRACVET